MRNTPLEDTSGTEMFHTMRRRNNGACAVHDAHSLRAAIKNTGGNSTFLKNSCKEAQIPRVQNRTSGEKSLGLREGTRTAVQPSDSELKFLQASSF